MTDPKIESSDSIYGQASPDQLTGEAPFYGASTFMRRLYSRDIKDVDIAVLGVPFDLAVCNRPGLCTANQVLEIYVVSAELTLLVWISS